MKFIRNAMALIVSVILMLSFASCSSTPQYSFDETLQKGYAMLPLAKDTAKEYTLEIAQGANNKYILTGYSNGTTGTFSLKVIQNGSYKYYKNLFLVQEDYLYVNMNDTLSAAESEAYFIFSEPVELYNRYLAIPQGYTLLKDFEKTVKDKAFTSVAAARNNASNSRGPYNYCLMFSTEQAKTLLDDIASKLTAEKDAIALKLDSSVRTLSGEKYELYEQIMAYLNDAIDIDTNEQIKDYVLLGEYFVDKMLQEVSKLSNAIQANEGYLYEGFSYGGKSGDSFTKYFEFCKSDNTILGSVTLTVSTIDPPNVFTSVDNQVSVEDFLRILLSNVKNFKGVGYETSDFPYAVTYTDKSLTAVESNDLFTANYVFTFAGKRITSYEVTIKTYEDSIHNALSRLYLNNGFTLLEDKSEGLIAGTSSGVLKFVIETLPNEYMSASDPVTLYNTIQELGLPFTYGR